MEHKLYIYLFYYFILSSLLRFAIVLLSSTQHPKELGEKRVRWVVNCGSISDIVHFMIALSFLGQGIRFTLPNFMFFGVGFMFYGDGFDVSWTYLSIIFLGFVIVIINLINRFSITYLHRDPYYYKFFSLVYILQTALCLLILTDSCKNIFIGWELLGLSSILLIAFYEHRMSVLKNSLIILVIYKISDILLYSTLIYSSVYGIQQYSMITEPHIIAVLLLACLIKSSILPWFWLPRAMEGPTQSTAVFYGGLATHIPVFIFMNVWWNQPLQPINALILIIAFFILISIICSCLLSSRMNDAKNAIAYSAITQLGIVYLEVIFGYFQIAIIHCVVHGIYRTVEFLKAPSLLYTRHIIEQERSETPIILGSMHQKIFPKPIRVWLYKICYHEFLVPRILMNAVENFMGLYSSRVTGQTIRSYFLYSVLFIMTVRVITIYYFSQKISLESELFFIIAYILNILAFANKYVPKVFFLSMISSTLAVFTILGEKLFPLLKLSILIYAFIIIYTVYQTFKTKSDSINESEYVTNFTGGMYKSTTINFMFLLLGLSIIGMPGLGTFFVWEYLEHVLVHSCPDLIVSAYILLALNTIVFFRFYYANFLGKQDPLKQFFSSYQY